ncbi:MAG: hypothetical protein LBK55_03110 [Azoarcus sp.]|jgi:Flp pilus assembly protein TadD/SAM-dependent methyltransferase|nr:hypothetical protein [Azoarcus sp.]
MANERIWQKQDYCSIYRAHHGFISNKWTHYPFIYDQILSRHLDAGQALVLLEIGVQNGGSLEIWKKYLPPGSALHGVDIAPQCLELDFSDGIHFHHGSATDVDFINHRFANTKFDIIIDDGSHICADVIAAFTNLFKKLNPGGIYIVEDLHTSFGKTWGGGIYKKGSSIEFFKRFADTVNYGYFETDDFLPLADKSPFLSGYREEIASVCFYDSICAITKFAKPKQAAFMPLLAGEMSPVAPFGHPERLAAANNPAAIERARAMYATGNAAAPSRNEADARMDREKLLSQGIEAFRLGCFADADAIFSDLQYQMTEDPQPPAWRAFIRARTGKNEEACNFFAQAQRLAPDRTDFMAALGENFLQAGEAALAAEYLRKALAAQPSLWMAYPALAQSLFQTGQGEEAVTLLESAASVNSPASDNIRHSLAAMLAQRGDTGRLALTCQRFSIGMKDDLLAARGFAWTDQGGEQLIAILERIQNRLASLAPESFRNTGAAAAKPAAAPIHIAFMLGDIVREARLGRLAALLTHLPAQDFILTLLCSDERIQRFNTRANIDLNLLLFDAVMFSHEDEDAAALQYLHKIAPDILIDLEAYGPKDHPALFARARIPHKLLWGETPLPPLLPTCRILAGTALGIDGQLPCVPLPGLGEVYSFQEFPFDAPDAPAASGTAFACLDAANRVGSDGWRLFAEVLKTHSGATLLVNLGALEYEAKDFIRGHFTHAGIAPERLRFTRAGNTKELCRLWRSVDAGLCPPVGSGDPALPAALWMGKPCLVLDSPLPWSRRNAVLLEAAGMANRIAHSAEEYIALARHLAHDAPRAPDPAPRARMQQLGLNDPASFARGFAAAMQSLVHEMRTAIPETRQ